VHDPVRVGVRASASVIAIATRRASLHSHPLPRDQPVERLARHELHDDEVDALRRLDLVDRDDVRVVEGGGGSSFLDEATTPASSAMRSAGRTLIATSRPRRVSRARYTSPMPPAPRGAGHLVRPEPNPLEEPHGAFWGDGSPARSIDPAGSGSPGASAPAAVCARPSKLSKGPKGSERAPDSVFPVDRSTPRCSLRVFLVPSPGAP